MQSRADGLVRRHNWLTRVLFGLWRHHPVPPVPLDRVDTPKSTASWLSQITWAWVSPLLHTGFIRSLELQDTWKISHAETSDQLMPTFSQHRARYGEWRALLWVLRWRLALALILVGLMYGGEIGNSLIQRALVQRVTELYDHSLLASRGKAVGFTIGYAILSLVVQWLTLWEECLTRWMSETVRILLIQAIFAKLERLSPEARAQWPPGKVSSLVSTDTNRIYMAARWTPTLFMIGPVLVGMTLVLVHFLGVAALAGVALVLLGIGCNIVVSNGVAKVRGKSLPFADHRISVIRETLENMRAVKVYGWEQSFRRVVATVRARETRMLKVLALFEGIVDGMFTSFPNFGGVLAFAVRLLLGHNLAADAAFPALTLFQLLSNVMWILSMSITTHADAWASIHRLTELFSADESPSYVRYDDTVGVCLDNVTLQYGNVPVFSNLNLSVPRGELWMVVGSVGSGKSTLLGALLGTVPKPTGVVTIGGQCAAVMSMWSESNTVRNNVLFGRAYDSAWYHQVVTACALDEDLAQLPHGDATEIGERGVTLSGGQRARLALARCVYTRSDIVVLDDVLSAVDNRVANHIMEHCICGLLKNTTRILATHNMSVLGRADQVVNIVNGTLVLGVPNNNLRAIQQNDAPEKGEIHQSTEHIPKETVVLSTKELTPESTSTKSPACFQSLDSPEASRAVRGDTRARGVIKSQIFWNYARSGSRIGVLFLLVIVAIEASLATSSVMVTIVVQFWTGGQYHASNGFFIGMYCMVSGIEACFFIALAASVGSFCFTASSGLLDRALERIYRAPMIYFDTTPLGRLVSRLTDDVGVLDNEIYQFTRAVCFSCGLTISSLVLVFVYVPWATLVLILVVVVAFYLLAYYRSSARELARIHSVFRSGVFTIATEFSGGMTTILGYGHHHHYEHELAKACDDMNSTYQITSAAQFWMSLRLVAAVSVVNLVVLMLCTFQVFGNIDGSVVGMIMTILPLAAFSMVIMMPSLTELENQLNSVERIHELAYNIPTEETHDVIDVSTDWPQSGSIVFQNVSLRYGPDLPLALRDLNLQILSGEKIGVVGRTGAGKSTLLSALFRLSELSLGHVIIDGVDISHVELPRLRRALGIIPQDPVLFEGTVRANLDPFGDCTDAEIWNALQRAGFDSTSLDTQVDANGANFSLGERQLLALARALLSQTKILVLDEATSSVDAATDRRVQHTISSEFTSCTVLCVAHRLHTILHYDRVLVLGSGSLIESGPPYQLFQTAGSLFSRMCAEAGITAKDFD